MPITYQEICEHIEREDYRLNGYKKETGGSDSTYVTLAPENYGDLHILIEPRANNQVKLSFEVVNATARDNEAVQRHCSANDWTCQKRREEIYRYIKEYNRNGGPTFFSNTILDFENEIIKAQNFIKKDFDAIKTMLDDAPTKKRSRGQKSEAPSECESRQIIYFGAPGTGKSYQLNEDAKEFGDNYERVTFYPGYSYQQFVGTYKPYMKDDKISYEFFPGPLLHLLEKALKAEKAAKNAAEEQTPEKYLLIVEELNRAEAAAVFGDLFQLLDRGSDGSSEYEISVSKDLDQHLRRKKEGVWENADKEEKKLYFPSNFYIWATMNSADQGVFPLDTAFKRRWDFKYFGIDEGKGELKNSTQKFWNGIREEINKALKDLNLNEDKLLGPFFIKNLESIDEKTFWERFCSKVLLYLYEDAARLNRTKIFISKCFSEMYAKFVKINSEDAWKKAWKEVFTFACPTGLKYPWSPQENTIQDDSPSEGGENAADNGSTDNDAANKDAANKDAADKDAADKDAADNDATDKDDTDKDDTDKDDTDKDDTDKDDTDNVDTDNVDTDNDATDKDATNNGKHE